MIRLRNLFFQGLLLLVPIVITVWILEFLFGVFDNFSQPLMQLYIGRNVPGAGVVLTALMILALGSFSSFFVGQRVVEWFEELVGRVPIVRSVYSTTRQVVRGFSSSEGMNFQRTVFVRMADDRLTIGFVTSETAVAVDGGAAEPMITVYVPTNHLYLGDVFLLPPSSVFDCDLSLEEGISTVLSCGGSLRGDVALRAASVAARSKPGALPDA